MQQKFKNLNGISVAFDELKLRKEHLKKIIIEHPRYKRIYNLISECHLLSVGSVEPGTLFLYGGTGVGKSTLLKEYTQNFPRFVLDGVTNVPVLFVSVPVGATPKSVASEFLLSLGDPNYEKGSQTSLDSRVFQFIERCGVQLVIIDEFQHLIDRDTKHVLNRASDWVKVLTEKAKVPIILCGMPESEKIFLHNEQLGRRFSVREELTSFNYDTREDKKDFRTFLYILDKQLPFSKQSNLADPKLAEKLYYVTNGVPSYIKTILELSTVHALKNGQDYIDEGNLYEAFISMKVSKRPNMVNPFCDKKFNLYQAVENEGRK
ncbi:ATP-binding protein [Bacillus sp. RG28]|uniref:ATP-binding protein n=1 Tax=Gottfriedia endophytica TaxID=2820819 RepID=A0A940SLV5_9BACI|nr:ATP-binding protein [Gottfriedia endophytica]MBP0726708.1 ATP-binding protein [Gottfriedia endophytica]